MVLHRVSTWLRLALIVSVVFCAGAAPLYALYRFRRIAGPSDVVTGLTQPTRWSKEVLALANDSLRTTAWHGWFSELPNCAVEVDFAPHSADDLQHLVRQFSQIRHEGKRIVLDRYRPDFVEFGRGITQPPARLILGDQAILNQWYERLPVNEKGERWLGLSTWTEPPQVAPPSLHIFVGHPDVALSLLNIPAELLVEGAFPENIDDDTTAAIREFLSARSSAAEPRAEQP